MSKNVLKNQLNMTEEMSIWKLCHCSCYRIQTMYNQAVLQDGDKFETYLEESYLYLSYLLQVHGQLENTMRHPLQLQWIRPLFFFLKKISGFDMLPQLEYGRGTAKLRSMLMCSCGRQ